MSYSTPPVSTEYPPYFDGYVQASLAETDDILKLLESQIQIVEALFNLDEETAMYRYAPEKWTLKQLLGHINDTERIFAYRLLRFARGDQKELQGFEQDDYIVTSPAEQMSIKELVQEFVALRQANALMIRHLPQDAWQRKGTVSGNEMTVNALVYITVGHVAHHLNIARDKYGIKAA